MRVEQQNNILEMLQQNNGADKSGNTVFEEKVTVRKAKHSDNHTVLVKESTYLKPALKEHKTLAEEVNTGMSLDAASRKNQMAVLSHTTSEEDFEKMQENGFSLTATNGNTVVTVMDKIKMQIARAGGDISCFGDALSKAEIEELTGNPALARQIEQALKQADLPVSEENLKGCMKAYALAEMTKPLTEGGARYMLDNDLEPTIENIYKAAYSSTDYAVSSPEEISLNGMQIQVEGIIKEAGLPVNEQTFSDSKWLIANEIALTAENLRYLENLKAYQGIDTGEWISAMAEALAEGKLPQDALLFSGYGKQSQAQEAMSVIANASEEDLAYLMEKGMELTIRNLKEASESDKSKTVVLRDDLRFLTARRQLEEVRLMMTAEANYALLKRGIAIDTEPLSELVEELKNQENAYYARLLEAEGIENREEKAAVFAETTEKLNAIRAVPAYVLGIPNAEVSDIEGIYQNGSVLKAAFERANRSYEPLMTAPRSDMGDSYKKAFRNVNEILTDLGLECTEQNQRAVRILAYNRSEITEEAIAVMKAADEEVQRTFKNLTPRVVLEMLRRDENPLNMDFRQLNKIAESVKQELDEDDTERFSEYLWKLERSHAITKEERSTYIGVYRLLHQVEQTDGAAIGALVNQGSDITLKNLLTAVRSANKQKKVNVCVEEGFGETKREAGYVNSITDQIMAAYQLNCAKDARENLTPAKMAEVIRKKPDWFEMTPEQLAHALEMAEEEDTGLSDAYAREQLAQIKQCAESPKEVYRILEQYDIPNSIQNILAVKEMLKDRNQFYRKLFGQTDMTAETGTEEIEKIKEQLLEAFGEAVSSPKEMARAQEALAKTAENVMRTMIDGENVTAIDIREARLMRVQLNIQRKMTENDTYSVPVLVGNEVTNVTLKIVHGVEKRGVVDIMLESRISGKIAATFQAKEQGISGTVVTDSAETKEAILSQRERFERLLEQNGETAELKIVHIPELDLNHFGMRTEKGEADSAAEQSGITSARLYHIAESFIRTVKETYMY